MRARRRASLSSAAVIAMVVDSVVDVVVVLDKKVASGLQEGAAARVKAAEKGTKMDDESKRIEGNDCATRSRRCIHKDDVGCSAVR